MIFVNLQYIAPRTDIENALGDHVSHLLRAIDAGKILLAGALEPRTGGAILINGTRAEAEAVMAEDPFVVRQIAVPEYTEFLPSKGARELQPWLVAPPT